MKSDCSAESWLKFFTAAGIPVESSRTYAVTFSKNEIQLDMLSEIKKEYLVDMGITLMGHIIAILRHAKAVYEENVTKSTLSTAASKGPASPAKAIPKEKPVLKTMPLRMTNEKEDIPTVSTVNKPTVAPIESRQRVESHQRAVGTSTSTISNSSYGPHTKSSGLQVTDKELIPKKKDNNDPVHKTKMSSVVANNSAKKKTTVDTSRQSEEVTSSKGKVFERLGVEVNYNPSDSPESSSSNESVFSRLGGKTSPTYSPCHSPVRSSFKSSLSNDVESSDLSNIKRVVQNGNRSKVKSMMCTMRADEAEALARRGKKRTRSPSPSGGKRLGPKFDPLSSHISSRLGRISRSVSPTSSRFRSASVDRSIALRDIGVFRSDNILKSRQSNFDSSEFRGRSQNRGSILSKRSSPTESIALSGLSKSNGGIKSRLGQATTTIKTSSQKKVSFGPVSQQLIPPLETKQFNRPFRYGRFRFSQDDYFNEEVNYGKNHYGTGHRVFKRLGY